MSKFEDWLYSDDNEQDNVVDAAQPQMQMSAPQQPREEEDEDLASYYMRHMVPQEQEQPQPQVEAQGDGEFHFMQWLQDGADNAEQEKNSQPDKDYGVSKQLKDNLTSQIGQDRNRELNAVDAYGQGLIPFVGDEKKEEANWRLIQGERLRTGEVIRDIQDKRKKGIRGKFQDGEYKGLAGRKESAWETNFALNGELPAITLFNDTKRPMDERERKLKEHSEKSLEETYFDQLANVAKNAHIGDKEIEDLRKSSKTPEEFADKLRIEEEKQLKSLVMRKHAASERLEVNKDEISNLEKAATGFVENFGYTAKFMGAGGMPVIGHALLAAETAEGRSLALQTKEYDVDEKGNLIVFHNDLDNDTANIQGAKGGAAEVAVEIGLEALLGFVFKGMPLPAAKILGPASGKAIIPPLAKASKAITKGVKGTGRKIYTGLAGKTTDSYLTGKAKGLGRALWNTAEAFGKFSAMTGVHTIPMEMLEEHVQSFCDDVLGFDVKNGEYTTFGNEAAEWWHNKFWNKESNKEIFLGLVGTFAAQGGVAFANAHNANAKWRQKPAGFLKTIIDPKVVNKLSNEEIRHLYNLVTSPGFNEKNVTRFLNKVGETTNMANALLQLKDANAPFFGENDASDDAVQKKIDEGKVKSFFLPPLRHNDVADKTEIDWKPFDAGHGRIVMQCLDEQSGISIRKYNENEYIVLNRDGQKIAAETLDGAISIADKFSIKNQIKDARRQQVKDYIVKRAQETAQGNNFLIVQNMTDLIGNVPGIDKTRGYNPQNPYVTLPDGRVAFVVDNIRSAYEVNRGILHEVGIHMGLRNHLTPQEKLNFINSIRDPEIEAWKRRQNKAREARGLKPIDWNNDIEAAEEAFAHVWDMRRANPRLSQRVEHLLRDLGRKMGLKISNNTADLEVMVDTFQRDMNRGPKGTIEVSEYDPSSPDAYEYDTNETTERIKQENPHLWSAAVKRFNGDEYAAAEYCMNVLNKESMAGMRGAHNDWLHGQKINRKLRSRGVLSADDVDLLARTNGVTPEMLYKNGYRIRKDGTWAYKHDTKPAERSVQAGSVEAMKRNDRIKANHPDMWAYAMDKFNNNEDAAADFCTTMLEDEGKGGTKGEADEAYHFWALERRLNNKEDIAKEDLPLLAKNGIDNYILYKELNYRRQKDGSWRFAGQREAPKAQEPAPQAKAPQSTPVQGKAVPIKQKQSKTQQKKPAPKQEIKFVSSLMAKGGRIQKLDARQIQTGDGKIPNFKENANTKTGVVKPLSGTPDEMMAGLPIVMEFEDGHYETVTGRHRIHLFAQHGLPINCLVIKHGEAGEDGTFTIEDAQAIDAKANILDGQGTVRDYIKFFKNSKITKEEAQKEGLLDREKGQQAFALYNDATSDLVGMVDFDGTRSEDGITPDQAGIIALNAPKGGGANGDAQINSAVQRSMANYCIQHPKVKGAILANMTQQKVRQLMTAKKQGQLKANGGGQMFLFGDMAADNAANETLEKIEKFKTQRAGQYKKIANAIRDAANSNVSLNGTKVESFLSIDKDSIAALGLQKYLYDADGNILTDKKALKEAADQILKVAHQWTLPGFSTGSEVLDRTDLPYPPSELQDVVDREFKLGKYAEQQDLPQQNNGGKPISLTPAKKEKAEKANTGVKPSLSLESSSQEEVNAERKKAKQDAAMKERMERPLKGGAGEIGQPQMDLGDTNGDLFNPVVPKDTPKDKGGSKGKDSGNKGGAKGKGVSGAVDLGDAGDEFDKLAGSMWFSREWEGDEDKARDKKYLDAVARGDMETAQRMVNDAAERAGYNSPSTYQGSIAFNGAAPYQNGIYLTKEERKHAYDKGEFEGTSTLGDYMDNGVDQGNLEFSISDKGLMLSTGGRREAIWNLRNVVSGKKRTITMYRSVPKTVKEGKFRDGDWVSPSREYARRNALMQEWSNNYRIIEQEVSVDDIWWDGNDIGEWGYDSGKNGVYKNTKNNRKLADAVTYDDAGNVIPLSKRFNQRNADIRWSSREFEDADAKKYPKQTILSGGTSLNQNPAGNVYAAKADIFKKGGRNIDIGAGKYEKASQFLADHGVTNIPFDPVNRDSDTNRRAAEEVRANPADTATVHNVLNVINNDAVMDGIINQAARGIKKNGTAIFTIYDGDRSAKGKVTSRGYQRNERATLYVPRVQKYFDKVEVHGNVLIAKGPKDVGPAFWAFDSSFDNGVRWMSREFDVDEHKDEHTEEEKQAHNLLVGVKMVKLFASKGFKDFAQFVRTFATRAPEAYHSARNYLPGMWVSARMMGTAVNAATEEQMKSIIEAVDAELAKNENDDEITIDGVKLRVNQWRSYRDGKKIPIDLDGVINNRKIAILGIPQNYKFRFESNWPNMDWAQCDGSLEDVVKAAKLRIGQKDFPSVRKTVVIDGVELHNTGKGSDLQYNLKGKIDNSAMVIIKGDPYPKFGQDFDHYMFEFTAVNPEMVQNVNTYVLQPGGPTLAETIKKIREYLDAHKKDEAPTPPPPPLPPPPPKPPKDEKPPKDNDKGEDKGGSNKDKNKDSGNSGSGPGKLSKWKKYSGIANNVFGNSGIKWSSREFDDEDFTNTSRPKYGIISSKPQERKTAYAKIDAKTGRRIEPFTGESSRGRGAETNGAKKPINESQHLESRLGEVGGSRVRGNREVWSVGESEPSVYGLEGYNDRIITEKSRANDKRYERGSGQIKRNGRDRNDRINDRLLQTGLQDNGREVSVLDDGVRWSSRDFDDLDNETKKVVAVRIGTQFINELKNSGETSFDAFAGALAANVPDVYKKLRPLMRSIWVAACDEIDGLEEITKDAANQTMSEIDAALADEDNGNDHDDNNEDNDDEKEVSDGPFTPYVPADLGISGAKPHPTKLIESTAMAMVKPPKPKYRPILPQEAIDKGRPSDVQLEQIVYAGQAHEQILPNGERRGYFIGDGTGVGKGTEIAGIICDNFNHGRKKAVWVSKNLGLLTDAERDLKPFGLAGALTEVGKKMPKTGIAFIGYSSLGTDITFHDNGGMEYNPDKKRTKKDESKTSENNASKKDKKPKSINETNFMRLVNWLGKDFDGVLVFDECHLASNAIPMEGKMSSQRALAVVKLQEMLPKARVLYVSATGATEVSNLSYATRLGLWGKGTDFSNVHDFIGNITKGGLSVMEIVARDMKAMGMYLARSLSWDGVVNRKLEHELTEKQREQYDTVVELWQDIYAEVNRALALTNGLFVLEEKRKRGYIWGAQQRFFNQFLVAMQMDTVLKDVEEQKAKGNMPVIQLVYTNEMAQKRETAKLIKEKGPDFNPEDLNVSPLQVASQYIEKFFPIQQYAYDARNDAFVPIIDEDGTPMINQDAFQMRQELLKRIEDYANSIISLNPIDMVLDKFGANDVAEITGRSSRKEKVVGKDGKVSYVMATGRSPSVREREIDEFNNGKRHVLIFSDAGSTGKSFHADKSFGNSNKRVHYLVQAGWQASMAMQGFGRTHRSNEAFPPEYVLCYTDAAGQKRFMSSIARRLSQLGSLTAGDRTTAGAGVFSESDNLENKYAIAAIGMALRDLQEDPVAYNKFIREAGYYAYEGVKDAAGNTDVREVVTIDPYGGGDGSLPPPSRFLNRLLLLPIDFQNKVFENFHEMMQSVIEDAIERNTYDPGTQPLLAEKIVETNRMKMWQSPKDEGKTSFVELDVSSKVKKIPFDVAKRRIKITENLQHFFAKNTKGRVFGLSEMRDKKNGLSTWKSLLPDGSKNYFTQEKLKNYTRISDEEAEELWNIALEKTPDLRTDKDYFVTGTMIPIWKRLSLGKPRILRIHPEGKKQSYLGMRINRKEVNIVLKNFGLKPPTILLSPEDAFYSLVRENAELPLKDHPSMVLKYRKRKTTSLERGEEEDRIVDWFHLREQAARQEARNEDIEEFYIDNLSDPAAKELKKLGLGESKWYQGEEYISIGNTVEDLGNLMEVHPIEISGEVNYAKMGQSKLASEFERMASLYEYNSYYRKVVGDDLTQILDNMDSSYLYKFLKEYEITIYNYERKGEKAKPETYKLYSEIKRRLNGEDTSSGTFWFSREFEDDLNSFDDEVNSIAIRNVNKWRLARELPAVPEPRKTTTEAINKAGKYMASNKDEMERFVRVSAQTPHGWSAEETDAVQIYRGTLERDFDAKTELINEAIANNNLVEAAEIRKARDEVETKINELDRANRLAAREWGLTGIARRFLLDRNGTFVKFFGDLQANAGRKLTADEEAGAKVLWDAYVAAKGKLDDAMIKRASEILKDILKKQFADDAKKHRIGDSKTLKEIEDEYQAAMDHCVVHANRAGGILIGLPNGRKWVDAIRRYHFASLLESGKKAVDINPMQMVDLIKQDLLSAGIVADSHDIMQMITGHGNTYEADNSELEKGLREQRRLLNEYQKWEDMLEEGHMPDKTGILRDDPTQRERETTKQTREMMKNFMAIHPELLAMDKDHRLKSVQDSIMKRMENEIEDLEKAIATGEELQRKKGSIEYTPKMERMRNQLNELRKEYKEMFPPKPMTHEEKLNRYLKVLMRRFNELDAKRTALQFAKTDEERAAILGKRKGEKFDENEVVELKDKIDELKEDIQDLRDLYFPEGTPEELTAAVKRRISALHKGIERYNDLLTRRDFAPHKRGPSAIAKRVALDPEVIRLTKERNAAAKALQMEREKYKRSVLPYNAGRMLDWGEAIFALPRVLRTMMDLSATLTQGAALFQSHPTIGFDALKKSIQAFGSEMKSDEMMTMLMNDPDFTEFIEMGGHAYMVGDVDDPNMLPEDFRGVNQKLITIKGKQYALSDIPGVKASERSFGLFLNWLNLGIYKAAKQSSGWGPTGPSIMQKKDIATALNVMSGRGYDSKGNQGFWDRLASWTLWAPRFAISGLKQAVGWNIIAPHFNGSTVERSYADRMTSSKQAAKEWVRQQVAMAAVTLIATVLLGRKDPEWLEEVVNPLSSNFLNVRVGNTNMNFYGPIKQWWTFMARMITGKAIGRDGMVRARNQGQTLGRFIRGKLSPLAGAITDAFMGKDFIGTKLAWGKPKDGEKSIYPHLTESLVIPLSMTDVYEAFKENTLANALFLTPFIIAGAGKSTYELDEYSRLVNPYKALRSDYNKFVKNHQYNEASELKKENPILSNAWQIDNALKRVASTKKQIRDLEKKGQKPSENILKRFETEQTQVATLIRKFKQ